MKIPVPSGLPSGQLPKSASVTAMAGARPAIAIARERHEQRQGRNGVYIHHCTRGAGLRRPDGGCDTIRVAPSDAVRSMERRG